MAQNSLIINSEFNHNYWINNSIPQPLLIHPILNHLIRLEAGGTRLRQWIDGISNSIVIDSLTVSRQELNYYLDFYNFLKNNGYNEERSQLLLNDHVYTGDMIKSFFTNSEHISFEVTNHCSLDCEYCCYGEYYREGTQRNNRHMSFNTAKNLLDYYYRLRTTDNRSPFKQIHVGFYGGEPLLNVSFVKKMVEYSLSKDWGNDTVIFNMTTNGVHLADHMDFLVNHDFRLMISLDGNESHNGFRRFKDGSPSFNTVYNNILLLKKNYPDYYKERVTFNAVIHKKNNAAEVDRFFTDHLGKSPIPAELSPNGLKEEKSTAFYEKLYNRVINQDNPEDGSPKIDQEIMAISRKLETRSFLFSHSNYIIRSYSRLTDSQAPPFVVRTGTCAPFSKKIFLTVEGKVLPCERVPQSLSLAEVNDRDVMMDFEAVAQRYNNWFNKLSTMCNGCANGTQCGKCMFHLDLNAEPCGCDNFRNRDQYKKRLSACISQLEKHPQLYGEVLKNE